MACRKELLAKRASLTHLEVKEKSDIICEVAQRFLTNDMCVGFYMATDSEVNLSLLLSKWIKQTTCAVPICKEKGIMNFYQIEEDTTFTVNSYGILEPVSSEKVDSLDFDIMFVPMVGFDEQLHRIGHGAGYYDCWLAHCDALKIGVAFELQKCDHIIKQSHDIDMDIIITEETIYRK